MTSKTIKTALPASGGLLRKALLCAAVVALAACNSDRLFDSNDYDADSDSEFVVRYMKDWYLWADRLPDSADDSDYNSGQAALSALKVSEDRYSNISPAVEYKRFFDEGQSIGFGLSYLVQADNKSLRVVMIQPQAPAQAAGLRRNDFITAIDGETVETLATEGRVSDAFGPIEEGVVRTLSVTRGTETLSITITKALYDISYVLADAVFELNNGRKAGYVSFFSFADKGVAPWHEALDRLLAAGAQDLIVDLRTNGGGLLATTAQIGASLGGNSLDGKTLTQLSFNEQHESSNRNFTFGSNARAGRFDKLVWLTSKSSCSASEALIVGLDAHRSATRIGDTTCGKPVGFTPPEYDGNVYSIVSFRLQSAAGVTDYFDGLTPDCPATDDGSGEFGSADEPLTAAALSFLETGTCAAVAAKTPGDQRSLAERTGSPQGLSQLTNLW